MALLLKEIFQLGLFENPYTDPEAAQKIASSPASAARADEAHRKSIVLLRNDRKLLPITGATEALRGGHGRSSPAGFGGRGGAGGRGPAGARGAPPAGCGRGRPGANPQAAGRRGGRGEFAGRAGAAAVNGTAALKALLAKDPSVQIVDSIDQADVALLWLRPAVYQRPEHDYADIALSPLTGVDVAKVKQIEAAKPTVLVINFINPWVINEVEPGAAAVLATFDVKAEALLDVVTGPVQAGRKTPAHDSGGSSGRGQECSGRSRLRGGVRLRLQEPRERQICFRFRPDLRQIAGRRQTHPQLECALSGRGRPGRVAIAVEGR